MSDVPPEADTWPVYVAHVEDTHQYADRPQLVALRGRVEAQVGTRVLLTDGTGSLWVEIGTTLPELEMGPLGVRGVVERRRDTLRVRAVEWTYDPGLAPASTTPDGLSVK